MDILIQEFLSQLPSECPDEVTGKPACEWLAGVFDHAANRMAADLEFAFAVKLAHPDWVADSFRAEATRIRAKDCTGVAVTKCRAYTPDSLPALLAVIEQARFHWAYQHAESQMVKRGYWLEEVPADHGHAILTEIAAAWCATSMTATKRIAFKAEMDAAMLRLTQPELFKRLRSADSPLPQVGRYRRLLNPAWRKKLDALFSTAQLDTIHSWECAAGDWLRHG